MKTVFVADSPAQAHLVAGLLEEEDIRCVVDGEMLFGVLGDVGMTRDSLPKVCVNDEDEARAAAFIRAHEQRLSAARSAEDADAAPRRGPWRGLGIIVGLWAVLGALGSHVIGIAVLPFVAICLFVHVYLHIDRAS